MALIPLKDSVTVQKPGGKPDPWGNILPGEAITYKCRIDEGTRLVQNQLGQEVVSNTQILIAGAVAVSYEDTFVWIDSGGAERSKKPIAIASLKDIGGKVLFTEVSL